MVVGRTLNGEERVKRRWCSKLHKKRAHIKKKRGEGDGEHRQTGVDGDGAGGLRRAAGRALPS